MKLLATMSPWLYEQPDPHERYRCPPGSVIADALRDEFGVSRLQAPPGEFRLAIDTI